jgi:serine/tyrosine/threonine adenylyltransferase
MHALSIPTTRSLTLIHLPALPVARERMETACVLARLAPSFLRIGSFQALNGDKLMWFGGGQQDPDFNALHRLGKFVGQRVLRLPDVDWEKGDAWGKKLVLDVARRNAEMVAGWQAYGFMHGVMNTDNISVLGLTIDYGKLIIISEKCNLFCFSMKRAIRVHGCL